VSSILEEAVSDHSWKKATELRAHLKDLIDFRASLMSLHSEFEEEEDNKTWCFRC
jgi:hypothetical protein